MSELYHEGILGQRKGIRNGPPYPLKPEDHSALELRKNPDIRREMKEQRIAAKVKKRIEKAVAKSTKRAESRLRKGDDESVREKAKAMTKEELEEQIKRLDMEKRYVDLMRALNPEQKKRESAIKETISKALKTIGGQAATAIIGEAWNKLVTNQGYPEYTVNPKKGQKDK